LVSGAAGAVGQVVGQIAVRKGLHVRMARNMMSGRFRSIKSSTQVIGSVGHDKKLNFIVNELGFSSAFNYKTEDLVEAVKRLAPDGLDI
jgi:NADPH-dependent curcumin reductase CurA